MKTYTQAEQRMFLFVAASPPVLHRVHYARDNSDVPICGTPGHFEVVGMVDTDKATISLCARCRRLAPTAQETPHE